MSNRLIAVSVFAVFGALTVFVILAIRKHGAWSDLLNVQILYFVIPAGVSAALVAALLAPAFAKSGVFMGIATMLLAQLPFSVIVTILLVEDNMPIANDVLQVFGMALLGGWYFAGPYQIATGALAGWITRRIIRSRG